VSDNSDDNEKFILIKEFEIQFPSSSSSPSRRRDFYTSDLSDEKIIKRVSDKKIGGDENINVEENAEGIVKEIVEEIMRTRSNR
jgi:hypothetical protein